jgi:signal transduction histidine kinase
MAAIEIIRAGRPRAAPAVHVPGTWRTKLAIVGALLCAASVVEAAAGSEPDAVFGRGLLQMLIVGVPIAVGLYALRAPGNTGFGLALLGIGFAWSLTALAESSASVPFTIGRLCTWLVFPCVVYLLLAFPDGRIAHGLDRVLFWGIIAMTVVLFYGTAPLVAAFPTKTLWSTCTTDCPANAVFALDRQPAFLTQVVLVREGLVVLLWVGLAASMLRRRRAASPLQRRAVTPAFVASGLLGVTHVAHISAREFGAPADTVIAISSAWTFCIVLVCLGFLYGLVSRRMQLAAGLARLSGALRDTDEPGAMRDALAVAMGDSTLELREQVPSELKPGRAATVIAADADIPVAVLVHDVALRDDPDLLDGVSGMVLAGRRQEQLLASLGEAMHDLEQSRRRIVEAADVERARIERDLHDGAQQRLIALRIRLGLAEEKLKADPAAGIEYVHELGFEAELALEELRTLAHGIYPSLLTDCGLAQALRSVAQHAPMPVSVRADGVGRHPLEIESAVYFTCVEAIQNAVKHASGATAVWVTLTQSDSVLRFEVRDDGCGFVSGARRGRGLRNMHDRIEALGGSLAFEGGNGTRVRGWVDVS